MPDRAAPREFESQPEWGGSVGGWSWHDKTLINPRFIAAVQPYAQEFALIILAGNFQVIVRMHYDDVVEWWLGAINA